MKAIPGFEFCAFRFLAQWQEDEYALYNAISSTPIEKDIRKALSYFQVSRTFEGLKEPAKVAFILNSLLKVRADQSLATPQEKVSKLTEILQSEFNQNNLSAASKLLWLSYRHPYVVYDGRAVRALTRDFGYRFDDRDYAAYAHTWHQEYATRQASIEAAVKELPRGRIFMGSCPYSDDELLTMAKEPWFLERVFDIFLWEVGVETED
jgi:hypothetical protein